MLSMRTHFSIAVLAANTPVTAGAINPALFVRVSNRLEAMASVPLNVRSIRAEVIALLVVNAIRL